MFLGNRLKNDLKEETVETVFVIAALKLVGYGLATIGPGLVIGFVLAFIL